MWIDCVEVDMQAGSVAGPAGNTLLTAKEMRILRALVETAPELTERVALQRIADSDGRSLDVHMVNLRRKFKLAGLNTNPIRAARGLGYWLTIVPSAGGA